jgi:hypothetical protein
MFVQASRLYSAPRVTVVMLFLILFSAPHLSGQATTGAWETYNGTAPTWSTPTLDVSQFIGDIGSKTAACITALPSTGGVCDARALSGSQTIGNQLLLSSKPIIWLLNPNVSIRCITSTTPCIAFGNHTDIECGPGEYNTGSCVLYTMNAAQVLIGPASTTATRDVHIRGVSMAIDTNTTEAVVDLTNTSYATIENSFIGHNGGPGAGLLVQISSPGTNAFYNSVMNTYFWMAQTGDAIDIKNGANEFKMFAGEIQSTVCAVNVSNTTGGGTNGIQIFGTSAETYTDAALCSKPTTGGVDGVSWVGARFESATGNVADIAPNGGSTAEFYIISPNIAGNQGAAIDSTHAITWLYSGGAARGYGLANTLTTSKTIGIGGLNQFSANGNLAGTGTLSGGTYTLTFNPAFTSAPVCVASDTTLASAVKVSTTSTALTVTGTASHVIAYICAGNPN